MKYLFFAFLLTIIQILKIYSGELMMASQSTLLSQSGFTTNLNYTYWDTGAAFTRLQIGQTSRVCSLPYTNIAGNYRLFVRAACPRTLSSMYVILGGITNGIKIQDSDWTNSTVITTPISFTNITLVLSNYYSTGSNIQDWHLNAFYLTTNINEAIVDNPLISNSKGLLIDYTISSETNDTDIVKGNQLLNSSFELGIDNGWSYSRQTGSNRVIWWKDCYTTNSYSGQYAMDITEYNARYSIISPTFRLRYTNNVWKPYTLSFYGKSHGASFSTFTATITPIIPAKQNFPYTNKYIFSFSPSTNWIRYVTNFYLSPSPSRDFFLSIEHIGISPDGIIIDNIQLEEGSLTDYSQKDDIEYAVKSRRGGSYFALGDTPTVDLVLQSKINTNYSGTLSIYNWENQIFTNITISGNVSIGLNTNTIILPTNVGVYRYTGYLTNIGGYSSLEGGYAILSHELQSASSTLKTNTFIGIHSSPYSELIDTNRNLGFHWNRGLSAAGIYRWADIEPTEGAFDWRYSDWSTTNMSNIIILATFGDIKGGSGTPDWAWTNGYPVLYALSNYVYAVVDRYKDRVKYWELINEPHTVYTEQEIAELTELMVNAIKLADPDAKIIAGGGIFTPTYLNNFWYYLPEHTKTNIHALSIHFYPPNAGWMETDQSSYTSQFKNFIITNNINIWNSESGVWGMGMRHGDKIGWLSDGNYIFEHDFEDQHRRSHWQTSEKIIRTILNSIGSKIAKFFYYDNRLSYFSYQRVDTQSTAFEYDDALKPDLVAITYLNNLLGEGQLIDQITNIYTTNINAYAFLSENNLSVLALFTRERTANMSCIVTNSEFAVYNMFGQLLYTNETNLKVLRQPTYWVSSTLTTNTLIDIFKNSTTSFVDDTNPPAVSIDVTPIGLIDRRHLPLRFKWTSIDDLGVNVDEATNVFTRYRIVGNAINNDWSEWNATRRLKISDLPWNIYNRGLNTYYIEVQTKDIYGFFTNTISGPPFQVLVTNTVNVNANIININKLYIR